MKHGKVVFIYILITIWSFASLFNSFLVMTSGDVNSQTSVFHYVFVLSQLILEGVALLFVFSGGTKLNKTGKYVLLWLLYALFITLLEFNELLTDFRTVLWWPAIYFLFYAICIKDSTGRYRELLFNVFVPIIYLGSSAIFMTLRISMLSVYDFNVALNDVYYIILLFPFIPFIKKKGLRYICIVLGVLLALYSFKRGAQICVVLSLLFYLLVGMRRSRMSTFKKAVTLIVISGSVIGLFSYVNSQTDGYIVMRFDEMEESGGSGREDIYSRVTQEFKGQTLTYKLFGHGLNGVKNHFHVTNDKDGRSYSAHNDFLEMLVDYGYIGLLLYLLVIIFYAKDVFKFRKTDITCYQSGLMGLSVFLVMSIVSHLFLYPTYVAYSSMLLGILGGYCQKVCISNSKLKCSLS